MRFLVLLAEEDHFARWERASAEEREAFFEALQAFHAAVSARGAVVAGEGLAGPERAVTLRGGTLSEGPYAETTEQVGGFYLVDLPSLEDAVEAARLLPAHLAVEVRETVSE